MRLLLDTHTLLWCFTDSPKLSPTAREAILDEGNEIFVSAASAWEIATDRFDLSAEQVETAYKLRWEIEKFFAWWKRHIKVYHLFARSRNGLMVQILSGLTTYLLLAIYCQQQHGEPVSIRRVRQLRNQIRNEALQAPSNKPPSARRWGEKAQRKMRKLHANL